MTPKGKQFPKTKPKAMNKPVPMPETTYDPEHPIGRVLKSMNWQVERSQKELIAYSRSLAQTLNHLADRIEKEGYEGAKSVGGSYGVVGDTGRMIDINFIKLIELGESYHLMLMALGVEPMDERKWKYT